MYLHVRRKARSVTSAGCAEFLPHSFCCLHRGCFLTAGELALKIKKNCTLLATLDVKTHDSGSRTEPTGSQISSALTPTFHLGFLLVLLACVCGGTVVRVLGCSRLGCRGAPGRVGGSWFRWRLFLGCCVAVHGVHFDQAERLQQTHGVKALLRVLASSLQELQHLTNKSQQITKDATPTVAAHHVFIVPC